MPPKKGVAGFGDAEVAAEVSMELSDQRTVRVLTATDLHQQKSLVDDLKNAVDEQHPDVLALVGDFLEGTERTSGRYSAEEIAARLSSLNVPEIVFVKGNHDPVKLPEFRRHWAIATDRPLRILDRQAVAVGPLAVVGFPCLLGNWEDDLEELAQTDTWMPRLVGEFGAAMRTLWLMHEPPLGTALSARDGPLAGNAEWMGIVQRLEPLVVIFGHDHDTPGDARAWNLRVGESTLINLGQGERLRFCTLDFRFAGTALSLPTSIRIVAYPSGEAIWRLLA
jgi:Icc-related predicted phosphoesterase